MSGEITPGYGAMLAEARQAKGLTTQEVADKLKLTTRQIEALEAEDVQRLPAPTFVRGWIRNYARLVELPVERLPAAEATAAPSETITAHSEEVRFNASPVKRWLLLPFAAFLLFLILVAVLYAWLSQGEEAYVEHPPAELAQPVPTPLPLAPAPVPQAAAVPDTSMTPDLLPPVPPPTLPPAQTPAPVTPGVPGTAALPPAPVAAPAPPASPASGPAVKPEPGHVVQLVADQTDAWIEVVSGDDKRYTRLLRVGEQLTLRGAAPFRLVVGNAATVRLTYDGRPIDLKPYTGDKVARLTLE